METNERNKIIAAYSLDFIGGKPQVSAYYNTDESKTIDILTCTDSQYSDAIVVSTIGLTDVPIGLSVDGKELRTELIAIADVEYEELQNIVASAAFCIMDSGRANYGMIIENAFSDYLPENATVKHAVLVPPTYWEKYQAINSADLVIAWLYLLPITDEEMNYIDENGIHSFETLLEENEVDTLDFERDSIVN
jgi:hypothetical protein